MMKDLNNEENRDFFFGLIHHAIRGVAGVAHHAIGAVRGLGHAILGDKAKEDYINKIAEKLAFDRSPRRFIIPFIRPHIMICPTHHGDNKCQMDSKDLAMKITNALMKDSNEKAKKDFFFGLVHHAIRGVAGVAHHAIGAVRGVAHHLLGDEDKQDYYYGYHPYHHYGHHHYYYGDDIINDHYYGDEDEQ